jgi:hypothetical protein
MTQYSTQTDQFLNTNKSIYDVVMIAGEDGKVLNKNNPISIQYGDSSSISAFGRSRISFSRLLGEYRYMYGSGSTFEFNDKVSSNGSVTIDYTRVCALMNVTTESGSTAIHQSKQYHPYIPGTSNILLMTFVMNPPKNNLSQTVGLFDDENGIFLRLNSLILEVGIRKNGIDTEVVQQSNWNIDTMDGSYTPENINNNPSGINIDKTKGQILVADYQWLGMGRVRVGLSIGGLIYYVHEFNHSNISTEVYMCQPSLPCRWEIKNTGPTSSNSSLMAICASVHVEGSDIETGFSRSISTDGSFVNVTNTTNGQLVLAIKLKNTVTAINKTLRAFSRLKNWAVLGTNDVQYKIVIFENETLITSPVWKDVPGLGWSQYCVNHSMVNAWANTNNYSVIVDSYSSGAAGSSSGHNPITELDNRSNAIYQNYEGNQSQVLAIVAYKLTTNSDVRASLNWIEIK